MRCARRSPRSTCSSSRRSTTRIATVGELRRYKEEHGIAFFDPDRERALLEQIKAANRGPLSEAGVEELVAFVLDLVKREVANA